MDQVLNEQISCVKNNQLALSSCSEGMLSDHASRLLGQVSLTSDELGTKEMDVRQQIGEIVTETSDQSAFSKEALPESQKSGKVGMGAGLPITETVKGPCLLDSVAYLWCKDMVQYQSKLASKSEPMPELIHGRSPLTSTSDVNQTLPKVINTCDKYCQTMRISQASGQSQTVSTGHITMSRYVKS